MAALIVGGDRVGPYKEFLAQQGFDMLVVPPSFKAADVAAAAEAVFADETERRRTIIASRH